MWLWRLLRWMSVGRCVAFARSTIAAVLIFSCVGRWNRLQRLEQGRGVAVEDGCPPPLRSGVSCVSAAQTADRTPHIRGPVQGRVVTGRGTRGHGRGAGLLADSRKDSRQCIVHRVYRRGARAGAPVHAAHTRAPASRVARARARVLLPSATVGSVPCDPTTRDEI